MPEELARHTIVNTVLRTVVLMEIAPELTKIRLGFGASMVLRLLDIVVIKPLPSGVMSAKFIPTRYPRVERLVINTPEGLSNTFSLKLSMKSTTPTLLNTETGLSYVH